MKILRIIARLNVGGPARHVVWLTSELQDEEFQSILIAGKVPPGDRDMVYIAEAAGVEPIFIEEMSRELSVKDVTSFFKIYKHLRRIKPDVVHTHTAKAGTVGRMAALFYRLTSSHDVRIVHTFHGHVFHSYYGKAKTRIFLLIEKFLARFATDKIVVISSQQFSEICDRFGVGKKERFAVIPLGVDLRPFADPAARRSSFREEIGASDADILIGFVGRLTEIKNISLLLQSAARIRDTRPADEPDIKFLIAGDGHMRAKLEAEATALGINASVIFLGDRPDPENIYAGVDIVALTSLNEGTPLSIIEAMASERPVVSTLVGGVADLLGETRERIAAGVQLHERGVAVTANDHESFATALIYLAKNEKVRLNVSAAGRAFVVSNYSKERLVSDIKSLYRNLIR
jgi:glycosyltransferase involved in cell wall biosynthesis